MTATSESLSPQGSAARQAGGPSFLGFRLRRSNGLMTARMVLVAMRNCTRDEGRSFEFGDQVLISNHRKLLWSKVMVVNVAEKPEQDSGRYDERGERKRTASEVSKAV
jgi:hypothetical protein